MLGKSAFVLLFLAIVINTFVVDFAAALSVTYSYQGNNFVEIEGEPGIFSTNDSVTAYFTIDCAAAHSEGDCANLPFDNYVELGAVVLAPLSFSAGPASLPAADGGGEIARFSFSTDSRARIVNWDMVLNHTDPTGLVNVDTDNRSGGIDSAAALGGGAVVFGQPGTWENDLPPMEDDTAQPFKVVGTYLVENGGTTTFHPLGVFTSVVADMFSFAEDRDFRRITPSEGVYRKVGKNTFKVTAIFFLTEQVGDDYTLIAKLTYLAVFDDPVNGKFPAYTSTNMVAEFFTKDQNPTFDEPFLVTEFPNGRGYRLMAE